MSEGRGGSLQVRHFYQKAKIPLELRLVLGRIGFSKIIKTSALVKDSLPVQLWGKSEIQKLERISSSQRKNYIQEELRSMPCLILTDGLPYPRSVKQYAKERRIALFITELTKSKGKAQLRKIFSTYAIPQHVLLDKGFSFWVTAA